MPPDAGRAVGACSARCVFIAKQVGPQPCKKNEHSARVGGRGEWQRSDPTRPRPDSRLRPPPRRPRQAAHNARATAATVNLLAVNGSPALKATFLLPCTCVQRNAPASLTDTLVWLKGAMTSVPEKAPPPPPSCPFLSLPLGSIRLPPPCLPGPWCKSATLRSHEVRRGASSPERCREAEWVGAVERD